MRDYCPIIEPVTQTWLARQITTAKTSLRCPSISADRTEEDIARLVFANPCTGFVEYLLDFIGETETLQRQEKSYRYMFGGTSLPKINQSGNF